MILELVRVLSEQLPAVAICDAAEKQKLKTETASDVQTAKEKAVEYKEEKEKEITALVVIVQVQIQLIESSNQVLVNQGSTTIPPPTLPDFATAFTTAFSTPSGQSS